MGNRGEIVREDIGYTGGNSGQNAGGNIRSVGRNVGKDTVRKVRRGILKDKEEVQ